MTAKYKGRSATGFWLISSVLLLFGGPVPASPACCATQTLTGEVVSVTDGDTITILDSSNVQHKVRLTGIDAPEQSQAFGTRSKQSLSDLVYRQQVTFEWNNKKHRDRLLGKVVLPSGIDANREQVKRGMAWYYKQYAREQSPSDRAAYAEAEEGAKEARIGLWQDAQPVPPWEFRRAKKQRGFSGGKM
jgi:endonuclease YncB( thermonuclease family)